MNLNRLLVLSSVLVVAVWLTPSAAHAASPSFELPALQANLLGQAGDEVSVEAPRRWHLGVEIGYGLNPGGGSPGGDLKELASASVYFGWDVTAQLELEVLASGMVGIPEGGGGFGGGVRALYWLSDHVALGGTLGYAGAVYGGPHLELRAGPFYVAYEPIVIGSSHAFDSSKRDSSAVFPLRALVGVQF